MDDDIDLTTLTALELTAYGDQAGWTTAELQKALELRQIYKSLEGQNDRLVAMLNDPTVTATMNKISDQHKAALVAESIAKLPAKSWLARLFGL